ncbi:MAG: hypothetical protein H7250_05190 [Flavobacterium sp.]|nr:hypothetical protein [Flavobacterium sp.]
MVVGSWKWGVGSGEMEVGSWELEDGCFEKYSPSPDCNGNPFSFFWNLILFQVKKKKIVMESRK